jgi:hypothetical protein
VSKASDTRLNDMEAVRGIVSALEQFSLEYQRHILRWAQENGYRAARGFCGARSWHDCWSCTDSLYRSSQCGAGGDKHQIIYRTK